MLRALEMCLCLTGIDGLSFVARGLSPVLALRFNKGFPLKTCFSSSRYGSLTRPEIEPSTTRAPVRTISDTGMWDVSLVGLLFFRRRGGTGGLRLFLTICERGREGGEAGQAHAGGHGGLTAIIVAARVSNHYLVRIVGTHDIDTPWYTLLDPCYRPPGGHYRRARRVIPARWRAQAHIYGALRRWGRLSKTGRRAPRLVMFGSAA